MTSTYSQTHFASDYFNANSKMSKFTVAVNTSVRLFAKYCWFYET